MHSKYIMQVNICKKIMHVTMCVIFLFDMTLHCTLGKENPALEEEVRYYFMMGQIVPDLVRRNTVPVDNQHFRDLVHKESEYSDGIIIVPNLIHASKYFEHEIQKRYILEQRAYISGILFHLWLDYEFFADFLFPKFTFKDGTVTDKTTGRTYSYEQFISKKGNGIYNAYDCMHALYGNEIATDIEDLPIQPERTGLIQYDRYFDVNKNWKAEIERFASNANFTKSAIDLDYEELYAFIDESSRNLFSKNRYKFMKAILSR